MSELPPYTPPDPGNWIQPWPRCVKCDGGDLRVQYERGGVLAYVGMTAADRELDAADPLMLTLPEHLLRYCESCGYWWREALAVGS